MEASTGIEPVYTDLQSNVLSLFDRLLGGNRYHDKSRTIGEHDTGKIGGIPAVLTPVWGAQ